MLRRPFTLAIAGALIACTATASTTPPSIWLAPLHPVQRADGTAAGAEDFWTLFEPGAPWHAVAQRTSVFKIYPELLRTATDDQLRLIFAGLASRDIDLALETPVLVDTTDCRPGEPRSAWMVPLVARLGRLGAPLRYLAAVGPLIDGHVSTRPFACRRSIPEVAADAARTIAAMRAVFPALQVGAIEPVDQAIGSIDADELDTWFQAFQAATGHRLAFLHTDVNWGARWQPALQEFARRARTAGIPFGVIYNADERVLSDNAYARDTLRHVQEVAALPDLPGEHAVFQSWADYPRHALPDRDGSTMTGVVRLSMRLPASIVAMPTYRLQLLDHDGTPVPDSEITLAEHDPAAEHTMQEQSIEGVVPAGAASALFALRLHAECACRGGAVSLSLTEPQFTLEGTAGTAAVDLAAWRRTIVGGRSEPGPGIVRIAAASQQPVILNSDRFPVVPGRRFRARFEWQVEPAAEGTGLAAIIFLGADGLERRRALAALEPTWRDVLRLRTDRDGVVLIPPILRDTGHPLHARYDGSADRGPASLAIPKAPPP